MHREFWGLTAQEVSSLSKPVLNETIHAFLNDSEQAKPQSKDVTSRVKMVTRENDKNIFFETQDRRANDAWVQRNYIRKQ